MADSFIFKVLKGVAKVGTSYMSTTADSLSRNEKFSDEQREQYRDIGNAFSDMREKLNNKTSDFDYEDDFSSDYDDLYYNNSNIEQKNNNENIIISKDSFNQVTFGGLQWYVVCRNNNNNTAIFLLKDIATTMNFSKNKYGVSDFKNSLINNWLNGIFKSQLESNLKNNDKKRLLKVFLLSNKEVNMYLPSPKSRKIDSSDWWLSDGKNGFIKIIKNDGNIGKANPTEIHGVRPAILVQLKYKT